MGLAEHLLGATNPFSQWMGANRNTVLGLSAGLLSGDLGNVPKYAMAGREADDAYAQAEQEKAARQAEINQTSEWVKANFPQYASLPVDQAFQLASMEMGRAPKGPEDPADSSAGRAQLASQYGLQGDDATRFILTGELPGGNQGVRAGMGQPIPVRNRVTQETGAAMPMSDGTYMNPFTRQPFDQDWEFDPAWVAAQRAQGTEIGKATGGAQFDLPAAQLIAGQTIKAVEDVRAEAKGMEEQFGNILGIPQQATPALWGSDKAKFQVAVGRLTNRAFLEAREMLRGGGQITDFESKKAEGAITSLEDAMQRGDKAQFEKALADFEQAVKDGFTKLQMQASTMPSIGGAPQGGGNTTSTGIPWSIEP